MGTIKVYYESPESYSHLTKITNVLDGFIELDATIAYPEGGGQEGDQGNITLVNHPNISCDFIDTILIDASKISDMSYPDCKIGGRILHKINDILDEKYFNQGCSVIINLNATRRELLTKSHSATHIMYMAIDMVKKNIVDNIIGCHIKPDGGRLDFRTEYRFSQDEIKLIEERSNAIINQNLEIKIHADVKYPDIRYWLCGNYEIPCGGTHVKNTGELPIIKISRKNIGKGKERVICSLG